MGTLHCCQYFLRAVYLLHRLSIVFLEKRVGLQFEPITKTYNIVNLFVYTVVALVQVQVRVPEKLVEEIDRWVAEGRFASRSEAIKTIVALYQERERTREFYRMLLERSKEAREKPEILLPLEEVR